MSRRQPAVLACICIGIGLLGVFCSMTPIFSDAEEYLGLHLLYILRGPEAPHSEVFLVVIDRESPKIMDLPVTTNKWPRHLHTRLLERLAAQSLGVIAFDLIFHESQDVATDQAFAAAMRQAGNVVLTQTIDRQTMSLPDHDGNRNTQLNIERMISAIPILADAAIGQAPFPLPKVPVKLNQYWCFRSGSGNVPTLPVVAFHVYAKDAFADFINLIVKVDAGVTETLSLPVQGEYDLRTIVRLIRPLHTLFEEDPTLAPRALDLLDGYPVQTIPEPVRRRIGSLVKLYQHGTSRYLNLYGPPGTVKTIPYHRLVNRSAANQTDEYAAFPKDAAVFIGQTQSQWNKAHDGFYTAFSGNTGLDISGVEIAATAFANLLEDKCVYPLRPYWNLILLLGWGTLTVLMSLHFSSACCAAGLLLLNGSFLFVAYYQFKSNGIWYPLVVPILVQTPTAFIAGLIWKYRRATIARQNIREAFGYYLPDAVVDRLSANLKTLSLGGEVFYGICLFTDAQNYTTLSETLDPDSLTQLMNRYYAALFKPIKANGGLILQVVGDSVMALWTAPTANSEHKYAACRAAIEITNSVDRFNLEAGPYAMPTRIGLHAGEMLLGNIGAMDHFEYRPVGDIVNTASRLEGLNKFLGTHMLVSHEAICPHNGPAARSVGSFVFKGKSQPVSVYELLPPEKLVPDVQAAVCLNFTSGLDAFRQRRWDEADQYFKRALQLDASDGPSRFYLERCRSLRIKPPNGDWDGSVRLERK